MEAPPTSWQVVFGSPRARLNSPRVYAHKGETFDSVATKIDGQRVVLTFFREEGVDAENTWNVALLVGATRKQKKAMRLRADFNVREEGRGRGRVGLRALVWAKKQLDTFQRDRPEAIVVIGSGDDRRKSAYRALRRVGFMTGVYGGESVLYRTPEAVKSNPENPSGATDAKGRHIPEKYLAGLSPSQRTRRIEELGRSRDAYGTGDWSELPSDRTARKKGLVKLSAYRRVAMARGFDISQVEDLADMAARALEYYTGAAERSDVQKLTQGLEKVYSKGLAAWKSGGHRPGASARNWADARVASVLVGGKAAWTADKKQFALLPPVAQREVVRQLPELYDALEAQGRLRDVAYIKRSSMSRLTFNPRRRSRKVRRR